jgi:hypothetical protein
VTKFRCQRSPEPGPMNMCLWFHLSPNLCIHLFTIIPSYLCQRNADYLQLTRSAYVVLSAVQLCPSTCLSLLRILFSWRLVVVIVALMVHLFVAKFIYLDTTNESPWAVRVAVGKSISLRCISSTSRGSCETGSTSYPQVTSVLKFRPVQRRSIPLCRSIPLH